MCSRPRTRQTREAVLAAARGESWISQRLAWVLAVDDEPDRPALSDQELRALQLYAALPLKTMASKMGISVNTVKQYLHRVQQKYRAAGRPAAPRSSCTNGRWRTATYHTRSEAPGPAPSAGVHNGPGDAAGHITVPGAGAGQTGHMLLV